MTKTRRRRSCWAALIAVAVLPLGMTSPKTWAAGTADACATSSPPSAAYTVKVCITAPAGGATLTGNVAVTGTITVTGASPGVQKSLWSLDGSHLLTDYQSPHAFTIYTTDFVDGAHTLSASAFMRDGFTASPATVTATWANGITQPPTNTNVWQRPSVPERPPDQPTVLAATGDGAGGETNASAVVNLMAGWNPDFFAYLGDVYEDGTLTEFRNWYGTGGTFFSRFRSKTFPIVGNHEYTGNNAPGYFAYWDNIPHYYSYDVNGWHFIAFDSTSQYGQVSPGDPQYEWFKSDLEQARSPCIVVYAHHPLYTIGDEEPATRLAGMWSLMRQHGVTLFLVGHEHNYQRWEPMDGAGNPDPNGVAEMVVGTGGHSSKAVVSSDPRVEFKHKSYGALRLNLYGNRAEYQYATSAGTVVDSGTLTCKGRDGLAPRPPTNLSPTAAGDASVGLTWNPAVDNYGVTGYRIYRNGTVVGSTAATTFSDTGLTSATTYSYTVTAVDAAGNESAPSAAATARTTGPDVTAPTIPGSLSASAPLGGLVSLVWAASSDNVAVDHYTVYRDGTEIGTSTDPSYSDTTVGSGVEYSYTVDAVDAAGNRSGPSPPASVRSVDTTPPTAPTGLTGVGGPNSVQLSWEPATDNVGITGYGIYRDGEFLAGVGGSSTAYVDTSPGSLTTHTYVVDAVDAAGLRSGPSDPVMVTTADTQPPSTPQNVGATANGPNRVTVSWSASTDDLGVVSYDVLRGGVTVGTVDGSTTSYTDQSARSSTTYTYTVVAADGAGNRSTPSAGAVVTTPPAVPIPAHADSYVNSASPGNNYGTATALRSDADPVQRPYFTFSVTGAQATVTRARLRVYATAKSTTGFTVHRVSNTAWGERTITWNNAPAVGSVVGSTGRFDAPGWLEIDVTPLVTGNGLVSLAIDTTNTTSTSFGSRESATPPQLVVDSAP